MERNLEERLHDAGTELREKYDEATIREVIEDVQAMDDEASDETEFVLRSMMGISAENTAE